GKPEVHVSVTLAELKLASRWQKSDSALSKRLRKLKALGRLYYPETSGRGAVYEIELHPDASPLSGTVPSLETRKSPSAGASETDSANTTATARNSERPGPPVKTHSPIDPSFDAVGPRFEESA